MTSAGGGVSARSSRQRAPPRETGLSGGSRAVAVCRRSDGPPAGSRTGVAEEQRGLVKYGVGKPVDPLPADGRGTALTDMLTL